MKIFLSTLVLFLSFNNVFSQFVENKNDSSASRLFNMHYQLTSVNQSHDAFNAKYSGENSLINQVERNKLSLTTTLFLGRRLWKNASFYYNPEISGGQGLSGAKGIAGFTNGETFRVGSTAPVFYTARMFLRQHFALINSSFDTLYDDVNQIKEILPTHRITIQMGKLSLSDYFDKNSFSHDPRGQFLNWSLMSNGAWDYPADTRGYTNAIVIEFIKPFFTLRTSLAMVPSKANGLVLDKEVSKAFSETIELEKSWKLNKQKGTIRILGFRTISQSPYYLSTISSIQKGDSSSILVYNGQKEWGIYGGLKYGYAINLEQNISNTIGAFFRTSWNDGKAATWAFTEIDKSISGGLQISGIQWKRPQDIIGIAGVINGISNDHQIFLKTGLSGFMLGDGNLNYGKESIFEIYYKTKVTNTFFLSGDYQFVNNPGYNKDRGPVNVFSIRGHIEF
jgi:high affinity Mn2+ porin